MKDLVLVVYHKNAQQIYKPQWLEQFVNSIKVQTCQDFDILEANYGDDDYRLFDRAFYKVQGKNFIDALNFLIKVAREEGYKYIANTNCDDWYSPWRLEYQLREIENYDVVSSNFSLVSEDKGVYHTHKFDKLDIRAELMKNHNIICHPVVMYRADYFNEFNYNPDELPYEDLKLWQRSIDHKKFKVLDPVLCYQRVHNGSVCRSTNNR